MNLDLLDIFGAIQPNEGAVIKSLARGKASPEAVFVEVGVWKGHSASLIGSVVKEVGGRLFCIDHWQGSIGTGLDAQAKKEDVYEVFMHNMRALELSETITPIIGDSATASQSFTDKSIDFLFIDADHRYKEFLDDLTNWTPKMKTGGIMCGHDCEGYYSQMSPEMKDRVHKGLDIDFDGIGHCGVIKGLFDYFNDNYCIAGRTRIWFKEI